MGLDNMLNNGQSEAGAAEFPGAGLVHAIETLRQTWDLCLGNSTTGIGNRQLYPSPFLGDLHLSRTLDLGLGTWDYSRRHGYRPAGRCVFNGIVNQIEQHLLKTVTVAMQCREFGWDVLPQCDAATLSFVLD